MKNFSPDVKTKLRESGEKLSCPNKIGYATDRCLFVFLVFVLLSTGPFLCFAGEGGLMGGAARVDITPPVGAWLAGYGSRDKPSDGVMDPLHAKALVLDDGKNPLAIVSTDLLWVPLAMTRAVREEVREKIGIPGQNVLICATHTHFGPKIDRQTKNWPDSPDSKIDRSYVKSLQDKLVRVILKAHENRKEVRLGAAKGRISEIVYNRRTRKPDGSVVMTFRLPPSQPDLVFGPVDPEVGILRVEDLGGALVGSLVNYACHPVSGAKDAETFYSISADYPGFTMGAVEKVEGGLCLFALGTAGNMNPRRLGRERPRSQIGKALGGEVLRRIQFAPVTNDISFAALTKTLVFPLKKDLPPDRIMDVDKSKTELTTEIQALRMGDIFILGLPGEVLVEIGLEIKKKAGIENLFIISLSNDACGYVCLREAYKEGGYESGRGTNLAEGAGEMMVKEALDILERLK